MWSRAGQGAGRPLGLLDTHRALAFGLWLLGRCLPFDLLTLQQAVVDFCFAFRIASSLSMPFVCAVSSSYPFP